MIDYLIVGQGLAGSVLSTILIREGKKVVVYDSNNGNSSSLVAAGLVNPVTGRRVVKSWMAETLIPFAENFYRQFEKETSTSFYHQMDVLEVIHSVKDLNEWSGRMSTDEMKIYLSENAPEELYKGKITDFKKLFRINHSAWMDIPVFVNECRNRLKQTSSLVEETFDMNHLLIDEEKITYKSTLSKAIIFCEGYHSLKNPLWDWIPLVPAKGEILTIECMDLSQDFILSSGIFMIPLGKNLFRTGSTFEWDFENELPTEKGKAKLLEKLNDFLKIPFTVVDHRAGVRPTVKDRRPVIGAHPKHDNVFLFNGMGTKGVQLAPYFANEFVEFLIDSGKINSEVNLNRFSL